MRLSTQFTLAATAAVISTVFAVPQYSNDDDPGGSATVGQFQGKCEAGMFNVHADGQGRYGTAFDLAFDGMQVDGFSNGRNGLKACNVVIPIAIRPGYQAKLRNFTLNYAADLYSPQSWVSMTWMAFFANQPSNEGVKRVTGPVHMETSENALIQMPAMAKAVSPCGESAALNVYISTVLNGPPSTRQKDNARVTKLSGFFELIRCDTGKNRPWDPKKPGNSGSRRGNGF